ncbi:MAG: type II toxin-antitoxin system Phd/YefM family antitoxin [bacterium]
MNTRTTISISQARVKIFDIAGAVQTPGVYFTLTAKGRPHVVMMSAEEFESWQETLDVMADFPDLKKDIMEFEADCRSGAYRRYKKLSDIWPDHRHVQNKSQTKRSKKA